MSRVARSFSLVLAAMLVLSVSAWTFSVKATPATFTYVVDTAADNQFADPPIASACANDSPNKDCTLRQAILLSNLDGQPSTIQFNIPSDTDDSDYGYNGEVWAIRPVSELPAITDIGTTINGIPINAPSATIPLIIIDGQNAGNAVGLRVEEANAVIRRLAIVGFRGSLPQTGAGILVTGEFATGTQILGCYIGVNPQTGISAPNQQAGIQLDDRSALATIGTINSPNVISGNGGISGSIGHGIVIQGTSGEHVIQANSIGVLPNGAGTNSSPLPNTGYGILISNGSQNIIGGTTTSERNYISSNSQGGILISGTNAVNNQVRSNIIGLSRSGLIDSGNGLHGVHITLGAKNNLIGSTTTVPLIISGNDGYGLLIEGNNTTGNTVSGTYIGLSLNGTLARANDLGGIRIQNNASNNIIGSSEQPNIISGNTGYGISIGRTLVGFTQTQGNLIRNNIIGLDKDAISVIGNTLGGILIDESARNTTIGGQRLNEANIISGNGTIGAVNPTGIVVQSTTALTTTIQGNIIGLRRASIGGLLSISAGNQGGGISIGSNVATVLIGGSSDTFNTISYNQGNGIQVSSSASLITIRANEVLTNTLHGISVSGVVSPTITDNIIRANQSGHGLVISNSPNLLLDGNVFRSNGLSGATITNSAGTTITNNQFVLNSQQGLSIQDSANSFISSNTAITNTLDGIRLSSSDRTFINTNIVSGNSQSGVSVIGSTTVTVTLNTLRSNTGGPGLIISGPAERVQASENLIELNKANGLVVVGSGTTRNITTTNNTIQYNTGSGIVMSGSVVSATIRANLVFSNTLSGIQLGNGGSSPHPQQVTIRNNSISQNGIANGTTLPISNTALMRNGIIFNPDTSGTPGVATNPNHDIDPPIESSLVVSQNGILRGQVLADGSQAACTTVPVGSCRIQIFNTSPETRDGQGSELIDVPVTIDQTGVFTASLGFVPEQLALTATDNQGNTSEFGVFVPRADLTISPAQIFSAKPGDTITVTHTITNAGSISFDQLSFTAAPQYSRWQISTNPSAPFALEAGETRLVTYTVTLPTGSDEQVRAGLTGLITVTAQTNTNGPDKITRQVADSVTVLQSVVLSFGSSLNGSGQPGSEVTYPHVLTNNGNITTTVQLGVSTTDEGFPAPTWTTTYTPTSVVLGPGISTSVIVKVKVAEEAQQGKFVLTNVTATPFVGSVLQSSQVKSLTNKTTATLEPQATMFPNRTGDAGAGETIAFLHTVQNTSNGTATFKLTGVSSQGSQITFSSNTPEVTLVNGNTFTISNAAGADTFTFFVTVKVDRRLLPGQKDIVTIVLTDASGASIGGASVQDTINITRGVVYPRLWLPLVRKP
ncbi:MAG: right-handed parallel beta-helix repeat-containing protein [Roseiflexaceae bacterium]